jgi:hypothetical protein
MPAFGLEFVVAADFQDPRAFEHDDEVGHADG